MTNHRLEDFMGPRPANQNSPDYWPWPERPKPPCSMREMAGLALSCIPGQQADINEVTVFVTKCFPYYRKDKKWHRSLANALYDNNYFIKLQRGGAASNYKYTFTDKYRAEFDVQSFKFRMKTHMDPNFWSG